MQVNSDGSSVFGFCVGSEKKLKNGKGAVRWGVRKTCVVLSSAAYAQRFYDGSAFRPWYVLVSNATLLVTHLTVRSKQEETSLLKETMDLGIWHGVTQAAGGENNNSCHQQAL